MSLDISRCWARSVDETVAIPCSKCGVFSESPNKWIALFVPLDFEKREDTILYIFANNTLLTYNSRVHSIFGCNY